jgi:hypothetical protein
VVVGNVCCRRQSPTRPDIYLICRYYSRDLLSVLGGSTSIEYTKARSSRKCLSLWLWWMLATAAGGTVIGALSAPTDFFWYIIMTGLVVGVAQWLVLRCYIPHSGWWVLASAFGWFLGINVHIMTRLLAKVAQTDTVFGRRSS